LKGALDNNNWICDINLQHPGFTAQVFTEYTQLWRVVVQLQLQPNSRDGITRKLTKDGKYSTSSAYKAQFLGSCKTNFCSLIWKTWAPPKCKFFGWLILQNRVWTSDRLAARNWPNFGNCPLCCQLLESGLYLFQDCRFTRRLWKGITMWVGVPGLLPVNWVHGESVLEWWSNMVRIHCVDRKGLRSLIILVCWKVWKERNARIFEHNGATNQQVLNKIRDEARLWKAAGAKHVSTLLPFS